MKPQQLANVLIKILGLSIIIHSTPAIITGLFSAMLRPNYEGVPMIWVYPGVSLLVVLAGVLLMGLSQTLAKKLFPEQGE